ncbi:MAG: hypothetical protein ACLR56_11220 [Oscillospiraceae bacterium]
MPVVKETVAHLGIAKSGPIVRYKIQVKKIPYPRPTFGGQGLQTVGMGNSIAATPRMESRPP